MPAAERTPKSLADAAAKLAAELADTDPELAEFFRDLAGPESTGTNSAEFEAAGQTAKPNLGTVSGNGGAG